MKRIDQIARAAKIEERVQVLGDEVLSMAEVWDLLIKRANRERVPNQRYYNLLRYLRSFDSFLELESYWFYLYDPWNPEEWEKVLDHVYRRSITATGLMN